MDIFDPVGRHSLLEASSGKAGFPADGILPDVDQNINPMASEQFDHGRNGMPLVPEGVEVSRSRFGSHREVNVI